MNKLSSLTALLLLSGTCIEGFVAPQQVRSLQPSTLLQAKGFGSKETPSSKATSGAKSINEEPVSSPMTTSPAPVADEPDLSQGKAALEKMRRERAELRNAELRKVKEVQDVDALLRETPEAAAIPERVAQRMGKRMLPFVGIPIFGSGGAFVGFWYMATYRDMEYQPALVAATSIALLLSGLLGITYSIMSASWDPDREGSFLGTEEFSKNIENIKTGLSRSRENARLRDKANDFSPSEWADLDKKDASKEKRTQSFSEKFGDELE